MNMSQLMEARKAVDASTVIIQGAARGFTARAASKKARYMYDPTADRCLVLGALNMDLKANFQAEWPMPVRAWETSVPVPSVRPMTRPSARPAVRPPARPPVP